MKEGADMSQETEPINQCDGCRRRLPLVNGIHREPGGGMGIGCTADRYRQETELPGLPIAWRYREGKDSTRFMGCGGGEVGPWHYYEWSDKPYCAWVGVEYEPLFDAAAVLAERERIATFCDEKWAWSGDQIASAIRAVKEG